MIDPDGYRPNVGIILIEQAQGRLFWARRVGHDGWQFPQGGMNSDETPREAMFRELREETGLAPEDVEILSSTPGWLKYRLPDRYIRHRDRPVCVGQKQVWFLLKLVGDEAKVRFDLTEDPEFDGWRWVDFWYPLSNVVSFKRRVYERALYHFLPTARQLAAIGERDGIAPLQHSFEFHAAVSALHPHESEPPAAEAM